MAQRPLLAHDKLAPHVLERIENFHADTVREVSTAVARDPVVVVGMAQNPFVKRARKALDDAGVKFTYLEYGSYLSQWKPRLAITLWAGFPTFPMVFVQGTLIGGHSEVVAQLASGALKPSR